jgi:hypothetical protein
MSFWAALILLCVQIAPFRPAANHVVLLLVSSKAEVAFVRFSEGIPLANAPTVSKKFPVLLSYLAAHGPVSDFDVSVGSYCFRVQKFFCSVLNSALLTKLRALHFWLG